MRIKILRIVIAVLLSLLVFDLIYIQVIRGRYYFYLSKNNRIRVVPLEGWRGEIEDRHGVLLAGNVLVYNVMIMPQAIKDAPKVFEFLSEVLGVEAKDLQRRYAKKRQAPFIPVEIAGNVSHKEAIIIEENKYLFPSLIVQEGFQRIYPLGKNSAHILGYVGKANRLKRRRAKEYGYSAPSMVGKTGIEEYYDANLQGGQGGIQIEVNSRGNQVRLLGLKEPDRGESITLTVDHVIQSMADTLLDSRPGVIIAMDSDNGEILAMTSSPSFDLNIMVDQKKSKMLSALFRNKTSPLLNRAIKGLYPPGSVFKVAVALCALDLNRISFDTTYNCDGFIELGGIRFGCTHIHHSENVLDSLSHSCNVFYYRLAELLGADQIRRYAQMLGLGSATHIDLPYEAEGDVPDRRQRVLSGQGRWFTGDTLNLAIGQGDVLLTPLQLVNMMAIVANEGRVVRPHVINEIGGKRVDKYDAEQRVEIKKSIFRGIKKGLKGTVENAGGTAHALDMPGLDIYGKTGTAQSGGDREHHAWFVGWLEGGKKRITFCVFLEHGGSSQNAVLLSREFILHMLAADKL